MTATIEEIEIEQLFDFEIPCHDCDNKATWVLKRKCCDALYFNCEACRIDLLNWMKEQNYLGCNLCNTFYVPIENFWFEPL